MYAKPLSIIILSTFVVGMAAGFYAAVRVLDAEVKPLGLPYKKAEFVAKKNLVVKKGRNFLAISKGTILTKEIDLEHTLFYKLPLILTRDEADQYLKPLGVRDERPYKISLDHIMDR